MWRKHQQWRISENHRNNQYLIIVSAMAMTYASVAAYRSNGGINMRKIMAATANKSMWQLHGVATWHQLAAASYVINNSSAAYRPVARNNGGNGVSSGIGGSAAASSQWQSWQATSMQLWRIMWRIIK